MLPFNYIVVLAKWLILLPLLGLGQRFITREMLFYKMEDKSLVGNVTAIREVKDFFDCSFLCMEYGPFACLSFNLERSNGNVHTCELSNSEKYLEPHNMQERPGYDYYGTTMNSLFSVRPCFSSPCSYGGTCISGPGLGEFTCQCKPQVSVLPFIDSQCNVDPKNVSVGSSTQGVFWGRVVHQYNLNFYDAKRFCELLGATLATYDQLHAAWEANLEHCAMGWLADSTYRYPMRTKREGCGNTIGIVGSNTPGDKTVKRDAWCYK